MKPECKAEIRNVRELLLVHKIIDVEPLKRLKVEFSVDNMEIVEEPPEDKKLKPRQKPLPDNEDLPKQLSL